jgi:hypothetical protein
MILGDIRYRNLNHPIFEIPKCRGPRVHRGPKDNPHLHEPVFLFESYHTKIDRGAEYPESFNKFSTETKIMSHKWTDFKAESEAFEAEVKEIEEWWQTDRQKHIKR